MRQKIAYWYIETPISATATVPLDKNKYRKSAGCCTSLPNRTIKCTFSHSTVQYRDQKKAICLIFEPLLYYVCTVRVHIVSLIRQLFDTECTAETLAALKRKLFFLRACTLCYTSPIMLPAWLPHYLPFLR